MTVVVVVVAATICLLALATVGLLYSYGGLLDRVRCTRGRAASPSERSEGC